MINQEKETSSTIKKEVKNNMSSPQSKTESRFLKSCMSLTPNLYRHVAKVPEEIQHKAQEIRLRLNRPVSVCCTDNTYYFTDNGCITNTVLDQPMLTVTQRDIYDTFQNICNYSVYSRQNEIKNGYITIKGGLRAGICGTAVMAENEITNVRDISSINLRIAREVKGCADKLMARFDHTTGGMLICGAPCSGKTTLLRDLARQLSAKPQIQVAVIDSRGEIAGVSNGVPQNDLGMCDVLDGYPRCEGISHAIRSLSPDIILCDEIGSNNDVTAIAQSVNSGVCLVATVHASSIEELMNKPQGKALIQTGAFSKICFLHNRDKAGQIKNIVEYKELADD